MFASSYSPPEADASQDISSASLKREDGINTLRFRKKISSGDNKVFDIDYDSTNLKLNLTLHRIWTLPRTSM